MQLRILFPPSLGELKATARAELLEASLSRRMGQIVVVEVARSYEDLEQRLLAEEVELAWAPPGLCARAEPTARAILKAVRAGRSTYRAALVGRAGEALSVAGLRGKRGAWVDPLSTGGYLLPVAYLRLLGHDPDVHLAEQRFHGSYRDALRAVVTGEADVAAVHTPSATEAGARASLSELVGADERKLAPFAYTDEVPNDGLVLSARLSPEDARLLLEKLLPGEGSSQLPSILLEVCDADAFLVARQGDYRVLRTAFRR